MVLLTRRAVRRAAAAAEAVAGRILDAAGRLRRAGPEVRRHGAGEGTSFSSSYGASGDQSRAVESGLPADIVAFSLAPDITRLVKANIVSPDWTSEPHKGIVTDSVTTFVVRKGNPKHIKTWDDLLKPGVQVLTPNPFTSGGARWNIMAAYGAQLKQGKTPAQALAYLKELFTKHVPVQDKSARDALQTFTGGKGDVLLSYENEAITAQQKGEKVDYVTPDQTILIENPVAVTTKAQAGGEEVPRLPAGRPRRRPCSPSTATAPW